MCVMVVCSIHTQKDPFQFCAALIFVPVVNLCELLKKKKKNPHKKRRNTNKKTNFFRDDNTMFLMIVSSVDY